MLPIQYQIAIKLISELYNIPIIELDSDKKISLFCQQHQFHAIQRYFDSATLSFVCSSLEHQYIYHYIDSLQVHFYLFSIEQKPYILGPFSPLLMLQKDAAAILKQNDIHDMNVKNLLIYYNSLPVIKEYIMEKIVSSFIHTVCPSEAEKTFKTYDARKITEPSSSQNEIHIKNYHQIIEQRYMMEQRFIENIRVGNTKAALMNLHNMEESVAPFKKIGTTLENERVGAAINRTTVRLAAYESGLAPFIIDRLSNVSTTEVIEAKSVEKILKSKEKVIKVFCREIQRAKEKKYSVLIQSCLYFLEHEYHHKISLDDLAVELNISKNHLIAAFKKEVGVTPIVYLTKVRIKQAAMLLEAKHLSISEISEAVGIDDPNYFVKLFKREYGVTPSYFRSHPTHK